MNARRWYVIALFPLIATVVCSRPAFAQTDEDHFQTLPFNFSNPGARPTAMGGAFIGLADDASAAVANPAGLTSLVKRQQLYFEYKHSIAPVASLEYPNSLLTGFGKLRGIPTEMPAFFNFATRLTKDGSHHAMTLAFSRHEFLSYKNNLNLPARRTIMQSIPVFPDVSTSADLKADSYSGALGVVLIDKKRGGVPTLRFGFSVSANRLAANVAAVRGKGLTLSTVAEENCPAVAASDTTTRRCAAIPSTATDGTSMAGGFTAGLLLQAHANLSVGVIYAYEPHFKLEEHTTSGTFCAIAGCASASDTSWQVPMNTPARLGVGLGYNDGNRVIASFDVVRVQYDSLVDPATLVQFRHIADSYALTLPTVLQSATQNAGAQAALLNTNSFSINNAVELHGGVQIAVLDRPGKAVYLRYGAFYKPKHSVTYSGNCGPGAGPDPQKSFACDLVPGFYYAQKITALVDPVDYLHARIESNAQAQNGLNDAVALNVGEKGISFGAGANTNMGIGKSLQVDAAFSMSSYRQKEFVLSTTIRFDLHPGK